MLEEMKKYVKPNLETMKIDEELMKQTSHKPGNGYGDTGHDGPPGHKKDYDEYGYESELWEL